MRARGWLLCWAAAVAATLGAAGGSPVVGAAPALAPRFKGRSAEWRYGRTHSYVKSGKYAKVTRFPYQVYLRVFLGNGSVDFCGGAIIGERHILSAAHCVDKPDVIKKLAVIGSEHRFSLEAVTYTIVRQTFYFKKPTEEVDADIVVLMVDRPMPLGKENIKLIKLQTDRHINGRGLCTVAGWGESRDNLDPNLLKFVRVPIVNNELCQESYPFDPPNDLLCAGFFHEGGSDTCKGDSGGPLVCGGRLRGIVKGGVGCGLPHFPGTYTDVTYYWRWVQRVMVEDCVRYFPPPPRRRRRFSPNPNPRPRPRRRPRRRRRPRVGPYAPLARPRRSCAARMALH